MNKQDQAIAEANEIANQIQVFDIVKEMDKVRNFTCVIFAKRRMGKTVLMKDLLYKIKRWYSEIHIFSRTAHLQLDMFDFIPKENIHKGFDEQAIQEIWKRQDSYIATEIAKGRKKTDLNYVMLLFDDFISDPKVRSCAAFNEIFVSGRHINIASFSCVQDFGGKNGVPKVVRTNLDLVMTFFPNSEIDREGIVIQYLSAKNKPLGHQLLRRICEVQYQVMVVANFKTTLTIPEYIFKYKADLKVPKFMIGNRHQPFSTLQLTKKHDHIYGNPNKPAIWTVKAKEDPEEEYGERLRW